MKLYYSSIKGGNFGDELNLWLWPQLLPAQFDDNDAHVFVGIGTLLNERLDMRVPGDSVKVVFGSGVGYGELPIVDDTWKIYFVRGPLSAEALGLDPALAITDGAVLLRGLPFYSAGERWRFSYMPHHKSAASADWKVTCEAAGVHYIDPTWTVPRVLDQIHRTDVLLAEAMHGAIVADALRVPWIAIRAYQYVLDFKWRDWCLSMDLDYMPQRLPEIWDSGNRLSSKARLKVKVKRVLRASGLRYRGWAKLPPKATGAGARDEAVEQMRRITETVEPMLSGDARIDLVTERCEQKVRQFRRDCLVGEQ